MPGFRRAQLRGSDELFRPTVTETVTESIEVPELDLTATVTTTVAEQPAPEPVPNIPAHDARTVRLSTEEIETLADAVQRLKFPNKVHPRPSIDSFERLEELRQKLLSAV